MMGPWGFVFLAYGTAWTALLLYLLSLKRRLRTVEAELAGLGVSQGSGTDPREPFDQKTTP